MEMQNWMLLTYSFESLEIKLGHQREGIDEKRRIED